MFDKIKMAVVQFLLKKFGLQYLVTIYKFVKGYRTQLSLVGMLITYIMDVFNVISPAEAEKVYLFLGGTGSFAIMSKLKGYQDMAEKIAGQVITADAKSIIPPPDSALRG